MAIVNHAKREINAKIVYYGPRLSGKGTSLRYLHERIKPALRGELKTLPASGASLLFFDFSPFAQLLFGGYRIRLHLYTLQGQVTNPAAWKMTLKGADGVVFVADATQQGFAEAVDSLSQLREFLGSYGLGLHDLPFVVQLNKRDLVAEAASVEAALQRLGLAEYPAFYSSALKGETVLEPLTALSRLVMEKIARRDDLKPDRKQMPDAAASSQQGQSSAEQQEPAVPTPVADAAVESELTEAETIEVAEPDMQSLTMPLISLSADGLLPSGNTTVNIPLHISLNGECRRFVISVTVAPE